MTSVAALHAVATPPGCLLEHTLLFEGVHQTALSGGTPRIALPSPHSLHQKGMHLPQETLGDGQALETLHTVF